MPNRTPKRELILYVLHQADGASRVVPTEDLALRAHQLFPGEFCWARHPHLPDKETARSALRGAARNGYVAGWGGQGRGDQSGSGTEGWKLTKQGLALLKEIEPCLRSRVTPRPAAGVRRSDLDRYRGSSTFRRFMKSPSRFRATDGELAELFRCRVDADARIWEQRLKELRDLGRSAPDKQIEKFVDACERELQVARAGEGHA